MLGLFRHHLPRPRLADTPLATAVKKDPSSKPEKLQERQDARREVDGAAQTQELRKKIAEKADEVKKKNSEDDKKKPEESPDKKPQGGEKTGEKPGLLARIGGAIKEKFNKEVEKTKADFAGAGGGILGSAISGIANQINKKDPRESIQDALSVTIDEGVKAAEQQQNAINQELQGPSTGPVDQEKALQAANRGDIEAFKAAGGVTTEDAAKYDQKVAALDQQARANFQNLDEQVAKGIKGAAISDEQAKALGTDKGEFNKVLGNIAEGPEGLEKVALQHDIADLEKTGGDPKKLLELKTKLRDLDPSNVENQRSLNQTKLEVLKIQEKEVTQGGGVSLPPSLRLQIQGFKGTTEDFEKKTPEKKIAEAEKLNTIQQEQIKTQIALEKDPEKVPELNQKLKALQEAHGLIAAANTPDEIKKLQAKEDKAATGGPALTEDEKTKLKEFNTNLSAEREKLASVGAPGAQSDLQRTNQVLKGTQADVGQVTATTGADVATITAASGSIQNAKNAANIAKGQIENLQKNEKGLQKEKERLQKELKEVKDPQKKKELEDNIKKVDQQLEANTTKLTEQKGLLKQAEEQIATNLKQVREIVSDPARAQALLKDPNARTTLAGITAGALRSGDLNQIRESQLIQQAIVNSGASFTDVMKFNKEYGRAARGNLPTAEENPFYNTLKAAYLGTQAPTVTTPSQPVAPVEQQQQQRRASGETLEANFGGEKRQIEIRSGDTLLQLSKTIAKEDPALARAALEDIKRDPTKQREFDEYKSKYRLTDEQAAVFFTLANSKVVKNERGQAIDPSQQQTLKNRTDDPGFKEFKRQKDALGIDVTPLDYIKANPELRTKEERKQAVDDYNKAFAEPGETGTPNPAKRAVRLQEKAADTGVARDPSTERSRQRERIQESAHPNLNLADVYKRISEIRANPALEKDPTFLKQLGIGEQKANEIAAIQDDSARKKAIEEAVKGVFAQERTRLQGVVQQLQTTFGLTSTDPARIKEQLQTPEVQQRIQALGASVKPEFTGESARQLQVAEQAIAFADPQARGRIINNIASNNPELAATLIADRSKTTQQTLDVLDKNSVAAINRSGEQGFALLPNRGEEQLGKPGEGIGFFATIKRGIGEAGPREVQRIEIDEAAKARGQALLQDPKYHDLLKQVPEFKNLSDAQIATRIGPAMAIMNHLGPDSLTTAQIQKLPVDEQTKSTLTIAQRRQLEDRKIETAAKLLDQPKQREKAVKAIDEELKRNEAALTDLGISTEKRQQVSPTTQPA